MFIAKKNGLENCKQYKSPNKVIFIESDKKNGEVCTSSVCLLFTHIIN